MSEINAVTDKNSSHVNAAVRSRPSGCVKYGCGCGCLTMLLLAVGMWFVAHTYYVPAFIQAQYSDRVLPLVKNVRVKIGLYHYEHGTLPGVGTANTGGNGLYASVVQTFVRDRGITAEKYEPAYCAGDWQTIIHVKDDDLQRTQMNHFAKEIDLDVSELLDSVSKPTEYRYWAAMGSSNSYVYCIGYFPLDDCGRLMKPGTGYAVLEIMSASKGNHMTRVATWERYKPINDARIVLRPATNAIETAEAAGEGTCWLGHPDLYLSDDPKRVEQGIQELKDGGWSFKEK